MILFFFLAVFIFVGFFGFFACPEIFFFDVGDDAAGGEETGSGEGVSSGTEVGTGLSEGSAFTLSELFSTSDTANNVLLSLE